MSAVTRLYADRTRRERFSPYPTHTPRTALQRFNNSKTDSGWLLLTANFAYYIALTSGFVYVVSRGGFGITYFLLLAIVLSLSGVLGLARTGYVMVCVARGKTERPATVT